MMVVGLRKGDDTSDLKVQVVWWRWEGGGVKIPSYRIIGLV